MDRTGKTIKNSVVTLLSQFSVLIFKFVQQTMVIRYLGITVLGLNGLFTNIVSMLSFAELGIGAAITYSFFKPLQDNDIAMLLYLKRLFKRVYTTIGGVILAMGLLLAPFIQFLMKNYHVTVEVRIVFMIFVLNASVTYLMSYLRTLLIADQRGYIVNMNQMIFQMIAIAMQFLTLVIFNSYVIFAIIMLMATILSNFAIYMSSNKHYKWLQKDAMYSTPEKQKSEVLNKLKGNLVGTVSSKIGQVVMFGTDNIIISKFVGLAAVGMYSNYALIVSGVSIIFNQLNSSILSALGNVGINESIEKQEKIFLELMLVISLMTVIVCSGMYSGFNSFITLWVGEKYVFPDATMLIIIISFFINLMRATLHLAVSAFGLFWHIRYKALAEAVVNLVFSLVLVKYFSIAGVVLGTLISNIVVNLWWDTLVVYKYGFKSQANVQQYIVKYGLYTMSFVVSILIDSVIISNINTGLILADFILRTTLGVLVAGAVLILVTHKFEEMKSLSNRLKRRITKLG